MGDRIAVFDQGMLLQIGTPEELYTEPRTLFVAEFIGSPKMNFIDATVAGRTDDSLSLKVFDQVITIAGRPVETTVYPGQAVKFGVRPHDIHLQSEDPGRHRFAIPVHVDLVEHTGAEMFVVGVHASGQSLMGKLPRSAAVSVGDRISFMVDPSEAHAFDIETGESLFAPAAPSSSRPARLPAEAVPTS